MKMSENQDVFKNRILLTYKNLLNIPQKNSQKIAIQFDMIFNFSSSKNIKNKHFFVFFDTKNFLVYVVCGQFSKKSWKKFKRLLC